MTGDLSDSGEQEDDGPPMIDFDDLYSTFLRDEAIAKEIKSPNSEDTLEIKAAIVGFSYSSATELWGIDEYDYVSQTLAASEGFSERQRLFYALGLGYVLGLVRSGRASRADFILALAHLPGFIFLKGSRF